MEWFKWNSLVDDNLFVLLRKKNYLSLFLRWWCRRLSITTKDDGVQIFTKPNRQRYKFQANYSVCGSIFSALFVSFCTVVLVFTVFSSLFACGNLAKCSFNSHFFLSLARWTEILCRFVIAVLFLVHLKTWNLELVSTHLEFGTIKLHEIPNAIPLNEENTQLY